MYVAALLLSSALATPKKCFSAFSELIPSTPLLRKTCMHPDADYAIIITILSYAAMPTVLAWQY